MSRSSFRLTLAGTLSLAACGSLPTKNFDFDAISVDEKPLPVMVVINDDWAAAASRQQFVNVNGQDDALSLALTFDRPEIKVTMAPVTVDDAGKPIRLPKSRSDDNEHISELRMLRATDPTRQLFILPRK